MTSIATSLLAGPLRLAGPDLPAPRAGGGSSTLVLPNDRGANQHIVASQVAEPQRRRAIAEAVKESFYVEQGFAPRISGAAALVVVCTREDDYHDRYQQPDKLQEGFLPGESS